jgi:hypothetical protein
MIAALTGMAVEFLTVIMAAGSTNNSICKKMIGIYTGGFS